MTPRPDPELTTVPPDRGPAAAQPRWRQDFPVDWPQDDYVSRRELVKFMLLTSVAFTTGQFWLLGKEALREQAPPPPRLPIARVSEVPVGGSKVFHYPEGSPPRILVRMQDGAFVAYEQQCTHLLCPVVPDVPRGVLHCPCHHGFFDLATGRQVAGPPPRPLARVLLAVEGDTVYATGIEARTA